MSRAGLIIALVLAAVLSVIAYLVLKPGPPPPSSAPLIGTLDIGRVRRMEITAGSRRQVIVSLGGPADAYWIMEWSTPSGNTLKWPAAPTRVRAALRLLGALKTSAEAGPGPVPQPATRIVLSTDAGPPVRLTVSETPLGGNTAVSAEDLPGVALGDSALAAVFTGDLAAWREAAVFPIDAADTSRLELTGGQSGVSLARVGKTWAVTKPLAVPGDGPVITEILKQLGATAVQRFADESDPAAFGTPAAQITVEIDRRLPQADQVLRTTVFQQLVVGGPADVGGQSLLCRASAWILDNDSGNRSELWGPVAVVIQRRALEPISTDPDMYIARTATRTPAADVGGLDVYVAQSPGDLVDPHFPVGVVRTAGGWRNITNKSNPDPDSAKIADAVLRLVTQDRADSVLAKPPTSYTAVAIVTLRDGSESQLDGFELGLLAEPGSQQTTLAVKSAIVCRVYKTPAALAVATWLADRFKKK